MKYYYYRITVLFGSTSFQPWWRWCTRVGLLRTPTSRIRQFRIENYNNKLIDYCKILLNGYLSFLSIQIIVVENIFFQFIDFNHEKQIVWEQTQPDSENIFWKSDECCEISKILNIKILEIENKCFNLINSQTKMFTKCLYTIHDHGLQSP